MSNSNTGHRTLLIWFLVALAAVAGIIAFMDAARYMGWLPIAQLGELKFVLPDAQWLGAILAAVVGAIWFWVAAKLYGLDPRGWLFVVIMAVLNLSLAVLAIIGKSTFISVLPALIVNGVALIIALMPNTKDQFGM